MTDKTDEAKCAQEQMRAMKAGLASREKYWSELSIEEKIGRMRQIVRSQREQLQHLDRIVSGLMAKFEAHSHDAQRVLIPSSLGLEANIGQFRIGKSRDAEDGEDCYF